MKKLILSLLIFISLNSYAQDSTMLRNFTLPARVCEVFAVWSPNPGADSMFTFFLDVRSKFRVTNPPTNTQAVSIDSADTEVMGYLYGRAQEMEGGTQIADVVKTAYVSLRAANSMLNRICTAHDTHWANRTLELRAIGRRLLRGK